MPLSISFPCQTKGKMRKCKLTDPRCTTQCLLLDFEGTFVIEKASDADYQGPCLNNAHQDEISHQTGNRFRKKALNSHKKTPK